MAAPSNQVSHDKSSFLSELRNRKVFQAAAIYGAVAWGATEVIVTVVDQLFLPHWVSRIAVIGFVLGFPVAMFLAWTFDITREGIQRTAVGSRRGKASIVGALLLLVAATAGLFVLINPAARDRGTDAGSGAGAPAVAPPERSIAVLPFENMSSDSEQGFFADGISEEILNVLARLDGLRVAGRTSSFQFKGRYEDLREIGKALNVAYVLEGSVRKQGERVRITAQLIKTQDGFHVWSQVFDDYDLADIFAVQDEIARGVAEKLEVVLLGDSTRSLAPVSTTNTRAYELFVESRAHPWTEDPQGIELVEQAIALDPDFARAHGALAWRLAVRSQHGDADSGRDRSLAESHARRALELDTTVSSAHAALGFLYFFERRFSDMEAQFLKGVAVDANDPTLLWLYATTMNATGRLSDARRMLLRVQEIDPLWTTPYAYNAQVDWSLGSYEHLGSYAERLDAADDGDANFIHAAIAQVAGDFDAASRYYGKALAPYNVGYTEAELQAIYRGAMGSAAERTRALAIIDSHIADLPEGRHIQVPLYLLLNGETDRALALFERETDPADENFYTTLWQPLPEAIAFRRSEKFKDFVRRIGLVAYWKDYGWPDQCRPLGGTRSDDFECE